MFDLDIPKMGYVIIYKSGDGKFGQLIVKEQLKRGFDKEHAEFTHVEVSGGGRHSINIAPPKSKLVDITKVHKGRYIKILRYKNDDYEDKGRYKVAYFSASLCNTGYDIRGVMRFAIKWLGHSNRLWFCSEGVTHSLQMVYPEAMGKKPEQVMPAHFSRSKQFETVFEGIIE